MTPGVSAAEMSATAMTLTDNVDKDINIPPYMQGHFFGVLATWKTSVQSGQVNVGVKNNQHQQFLES